MIEVANSNGFGIKRLRILNTFGNLKAHLILFLIVSAWCLNQGLSIVKTFSRLDVQAALVTIVKKFADDTKLGQIVRTDQDRAALQDA
jgi:hypothetical protein